jgi:hypothetical protein
MFCKLWHIACSPLRNDFAQIDLPLRSICTSTRTSAKRRIDRQLWTKAACPEFRSGQVQIILFLELMIGKFVPGGESDAPRFAIVAFR